MQEEGPGEAILADGVALAQHSLGLKLLVQLEERLIEQRGQGKVGSVFRQHRVQGVVGVDSQSEGNRLAGGVLPLGGGAVSILGGGGVALGRAARQQQGRTQQKRQQRS